MNRQLSFVSTLFALILVPAWNSIAIPLGPGFTYQGTIEDNGDPVEAPVTLRFSLWDDYEDGNPIGFSQRIFEVPIVEGVFTVIVNSAGEFGPEAFTGDARWLQIEICADVDCASTDVLYPRQPILAAPYAHHAPGPWKSNGAGTLFSLDQVGIGTDSPSTRLQVNDGRIRIGESGTQERWDLFYDPPSQKFYFQENASFNHLVFTKGPESRLGIGTDSPSAKLDVRASDAAPALRIAANESSGTALEIGAGMIRIPGAGANTATPVFIHIADSANSRFCDNSGCFCYQTVISHPMTDNDPSAILFAMVNGQAGSGHPQINRIYYDPEVNKWVIACTFNEYFCAGQQFNILVFKG